jgi:prepilin-type N-terminal cleavage/methylation domain-containing protein
MKKSSAFSLIELSIVILIIGIIIAGVTQSSSLLAKARLQSAQILTKSSPVAGIPGLVAWFEPTLDESFLQGENEEGASITQWNDINPQSSSKYFLVQPIDYNPYGTYGATSGAGGLPALNFSSGATMSLSRFNASSDGCCIPLDIKLEALTMFAVYLTNGSDNPMSFYQFKQNASQSTQIHFRYSFGEGRTIWLFHYDNITLDSQDLSLDEISNPESGVAEVASISSSGYDINLYVNGTSHIASHPSERISSPDYPFGTFSIEASDTHLSELIVFDRPLKKEERQAIEDYLGQKYSIKIIHTDAP